jgi:nucleotide-binding universal stress UspA family protein
MKRIRTILHPTDFSPGSAAAFAAACDLARDYDARLIVLHAFGPVVPVGAEGVIVSADLDELRAIARKELDAVRPTNPAVRVERVVREGPSTQVILEAAKEFGADLIVIGTHGRTGFRRLLLGSVTEEVLRKAPCPVLTVKAPAPAAGRPVETAADLVGAGI